MQLSKVGFVKGYVNVALFAMTLVISTGQINCATWILHRCCLNPRCLR